jgi:hypothetical protein
MAIRHTTLLCLCLTICITFIQLANATPLPDPFSDSSSPGGLSGYDYGYDTAPIPKRQNDPQIAVTGPLGGTGNGSAPPQRIEIRQLQNNTDLWTLYILGLDMMQHTDQSSPTSWYQIAGQCWNLQLLHGEPFHF